MLKEKDTEKILKNTTQDTQENPTWLILDFSLEMVKASTKYTQKNTINQKPFIQQKLFFQKWKQNKFSAQKWKNLMVTKDFYKK
jgi:hypothetical protein